MDQDSRRKPADQGQRASFNTTLWSVVVAAGNRESPGAHEALSSLCQTYWYPLYAYVRRRSTCREAAQDLTQEFFARLLEKNRIAVAKPERGHFRAFLMTALKNFLANEADGARTQKRGGGKLSLALDFDSGETRFNLEPYHDLTPDRLFERRWALTLLDGVMTQLRDELVTAGKSRQFDLLKDFISGERDGTSYAQAAAGLDMSEGAARTAAHRLRRRYREILRAEIAETVADPQDVDSEISRLFESLKS